MEKSSFPGRANRLVAIFLLLSLVARAQVLPLDSVLGRIERNNLMLGMYDEQVKAAGNYAQMSRSWMPPTLSTGPWQAPYNRFNEGMWMITAEQMIPNPSQRKANTNYMQAMANVEVQEKAAKRNELFASAKKSYYEWTVLQRKTAVALQMDSLLSYMVQASRSRYSYKKEKLSNLYKAQADLHELRNMEIMLAAEIKMRNIDLNSLMNEDQSLVFEVDTTIPASVYAFVPDTGTIASSRSDIRKYDASLSMLKLQAEYEKSKRLPQFGLSFSHMQAMSDMPNQFSAMGMVTLPIVPWASKEYKYSVKALANASKGVELQKQALINETTGMVASLMAEMESARKQLANYTDSIVPSYRDGFHSALLEYEQYNEELFVVLDALRMYLMAKMNELDKLDSYLQLRVEYEKQMEIR